MLRELDRIEEPFTTPANAGPLSQANAVGSFGSIRWGDAVKLMLRIEPSGRIADARFQAFGGSSAITTSSAAARIVTGKTLDEAAAITAVDIAETAGGLPRHRMYCAVMNYEALQRAIADYRGDQSLAEADGAPACKCLGVGQMLIERTIRFNRLTSLDEVTDYTKAASSCSSCFKQVETLLARVNAEMVEDGLIEPAKAYRPGSSPQRAVDLKPTGAPGPAANIFAAKAAPAHLRAAPKSPPPKPAPVPGAAQVDAPPQEVLITEAIEEMRPHLQRDGGDCEFVSIDGNMVYVRLSGNCVGCQLSSVTLSGVQAKLAEKVGRPLRVVPVS